MKLLDNVDQNNPVFKKLRKQLDPLYKTLIDKVKAYNPNCNEQMLQTAYLFGLWAHREQHRLSGEPYFEHCLNVALILADMHMDSTTIAAGLLHDVVEDTDYTLKEIHDEFGEQIALLIDGVTKIGVVVGRKGIGQNGETRVTDLFKGENRKSEARRKEASKAETFRKMLLSMAKDIRVMIIKFADRLHNMRTLQHMPAKNRQRIAIETRDVYAPLADRFGMARVKSELEDLAFKYVDNKAYNDLKNRLNEKREMRESYIEKVIEPIKRDLAAHNIKAEVFGRPKHLLSIYRKMQIRQKAFGEIYDLFAIRVIVEKPEECYYVLGIVHNIYTPVYERFKDYIAMPKINGYQSLHTTVMDKEGRMVEIQIRTREMHRIAELGIAAHWRYKEGMPSGKSDDFDQQMGWVRQLLDQFKGSEEVDAKEFLETLKIDLYRDEVFVFTPAGDVIRLPLKSTPVDFAYAVHSNVGMHCIGAKVNGKIVPLKYQLNSGEQVEIITSANQHPSQSWLTFVKTSKARHQIRKYLREVQFHDSVKLGDEIITKYFRKYGVKDKDTKMAEAAAKLNFENPTYLAAAVGRGEVSLEKIFGAITEGKAKKPQGNLLNKILRSKNSSAIRVQGMDNVMVQIGKCCEPVPGDEIIGYITRGKGVTIHRTACRNMQSLVEKNDRTIPVNWTVESEEEFRVRLTLLGEDRRNLLRDIAQAIANHDVNILNLEIKSRDKLATGKLVIQVQNLPHLTRVINAISKIKGVLSVERIEAASRGRKN